MLGEFLDAVTSHLAGLGNEFFKFLTLMETEVNSGLVSQLITGRFIANLISFSFWLLLQKQTLTVHFYLSTHPSEKLVFALNGIRRTRTHVSLITSRAC